MVLVGLLGRKRSGKDTMADLLVEEYGFHKITLAGPLKEACRILFNFSEDQLYGESKEEEDSHWKVTPRRTLQYLGTDIIRNKISELIPWIGNRFWLERFNSEYQKLQKLYGPNVNVVLADLRFQNEVDYMNDLKGTVIKIERPNFIVPDEHESEKLIDDITGFDHRLINDKTVSEYRESIKKLIESLISE